MPSHKRTAVDREITFTRPNATCLCCYDTGLVQNGDGLASRWIPDYDTLPDGRRIHGLDAGLVCHCTAAYAESGPDGAPLRGGCREGSGQIRSVQSDVGPRYVGADFPKEAGREIHRQRLESWKQTEAEMNRARMARSTGDGDAMPWFVAEVRDHLMKLAQASDSGARTDDRLASLGQVLGTAPTADQSLDAGRAAAARALAAYEARCAAKCD
jgi:hypothetical protein